MSQREIVVQDAAGHSAAAELVERAGDGTLTLRMADGRVLLVPPEAIEAHEGPVLRLASRFAALEPPEPSGGGPTDGELEDRTIPVIEERPIVETHAFPTGTVHVHTHTTEREELVEEVLTRETVDVERVPINSIVDAPSPAREEGDTLIVPLYEEVLVVEKRLLLREEVRLTKRREERRERQRIRLKSEEAEIQRTDPKNNDPKSG